MKTRIGINGAGGRMGQRLVALASADPSLRLVAALEHARHPRLGQDAGEVAGVGPAGVALSSSLPDGLGIDCLIDFSVPAATRAVLPLCTARRLPLVVATTGFEPHEKAEVEAAAHETALLFSPNMSLVVNVLFALCRQAATLLKGRDFDVEIVERHHRFKKDAPSGTAARFAQIVQEAMGGDVVHGREGLVGERPAGQIGMHALRVGDDVGRHAIIFGTMGETLELVHEGHTRDSYAKGALEAAKFLAGKGPGRYSMSDVLGIS
ncbi:MAG: 4-hydroxy-tetrahydrodipicolinate reductase [Gemmataceae bacterium]|nr:4-hydroxy-tetrahydrodipicolinate reductase [Gemmataceae bacterium]